MNPPITEVDHRTCGVAIRDMLVCNFLGWLNLITFFFDGEALTYTYGIGNSVDTPREAVHEAHKLGFMEEAQLRFLEDVDLNMGVPH